MKKFILLFSFLMAACANDGSQMVYATAAVASTAVPTFTEAPTLQPTPTIGYQATAEVAQLTAEAAMRLNVAVTAEAEQRLHQEMAWTAEANVRQQEILNWTATAMPTSLALTATQQAVLNTQIPAQQALMAAQITATNEAPSLLIEMRAAENAVKYWWVDSLLLIVVAFSIGLFLISCCVVMFRDDARKRERIVQERESNRKVNEANDLPFIHPVDLKTIVEANKENGQGYSSSKRMVVPCTVDQLTELADGLINQNKSLAINQWEGKNSKSFTRPVFVAVRNFLQTNRLAQSTGSGILMLTNEGSAFLLGWLANRSLPSLYELEPESYNLRGESTHEHENHKHDHAVGEADLAKLGLKPLLDLPQVQRRYELPSTAAKIAPPLRTMQKGRLV